LEDYFFEVNKASWNHRAELHVEEEFYRLKEFIRGESSLNQIELELLEDISGLDILHPMCHFGMDSLSMVRMGANVCGADLSDVAIEKAKNLAKRIAVEAEFINCNYYDLLDHLPKKYDLFFSSYGVVGWLPDLNEWARIAYDSLKEKGKLVLVEFHPVVWMFDDDFNKIAYSYFKEEVINTEEASYTDKESTDKKPFYSWNHSLSEVFSALLDAGFSIEDFREYDYSPYDCFRNTIEVEKGKYRIDQFKDKLPMVYSIVASKS
jgi:2-polyprenyl-3-methyl-5-hydroxy-6-metoxy-1,4-benzoquinol methylase